VTAGQAWLPGAVTAVSLAGGTSILIYALWEARLDYQEHELRVKLLKRIEQQALPGSAPSAAEEPGADLGEEFGANPVDASALVDSLAKFTEALKGLPRSVQGFLVAGLFYILALVTAMIAGILF
jgi:hypothetical protein